MKAAAPPTPAPARPADRAALGGVVALAVAGGSSFLNVFATQPLLPLLQQSFGVSKAVAALTVSAPSFAVAFASPFAGSVSARFGRRRTIVGALFLLAAPTLLAATSGGIRALVAWRFVQGMIVPGIYAVAIAYVGAEWPDRVGRAMTAIVSGNVIGGFLGRIVAGTVAGFAGWRASFLALVVVTLAGASFVRRFLPESARPAPSTGARPGERGALGRALRDPRSLSTLPIGFSLLFTQLATFTYVGYHLAGPPFRLGPVALNWMFAVYLFGAAVTPFAGGLIDRLGSRAVLTLALLGLIAAGSLTLVPSTAVVIAGLSLSCTAVFVGQAATASYLASAIRAELRGATSGLYVSVYYVGGAVGGVLPAATWSWRGWPACVALITAVQLAALVVALRFWVPRVAAAAPSAIASAGVPLDVP